MATIAAIGPTTKKAAMGILSSRLARCQRGGVALIFLVAFTTLAVPLALGAVKVADQLALNSRVWEGRLNGHNFAVSGVEAAIAQIQIDPSFAGAIALDLDGDGVDDFTNTVINLPQTITIEALADIVLALDNSGSIDDVEILGLKAVANAIVDGFSLSTAGGRIRIGVTRFRGSGESIVGMTDVDVHPTGIPVHDGINGLVQAGSGLAGGTNIVAGIQSAQAQFSTGLGERDGVPNIIILFTDGNDSVGNNNSAITAVSAGSGAEVFAVGIGTQAEVSPETLFAIAFDPDNTDAVFDSNNPDPYIVASTGPKSQALPLSPGDRLG